MPVAGKQLNVGMALALCHHVGFRRGGLTTAVALMTAESGRYVEAYHENLNEDGTLSSTDRGLFQINDRWHFDLSDAEAYCAIPNAVYAFWMSGGEDFSAWAAFNSGAYQTYVPLVLATKALQIWRNKLPYVAQRLACP
jgi:hypothetical protein